MATLIVSYDEGAPTALPVVAGTNTSEWSYDRPEHVTDFGGVQHAKAPVLYTFETTIDSASEYIGSIYRVTLPVDSSRTLTCLTLDMSPSSTFIPFRPSGSPTAAWAAQAMLAITLEGPAGTPPSLFTLGCVGVGGEGDDDGDGVADDADECPNTPAGTAVDDLGCPLEGGVTVDETFTGLADATGGETSSPGSADEVPDAILTAIDNAAAGASFDAVFIIDNTGSMFDDIDAVKARINEIVNRIQANGDGTQRVGVMTYADLCADDPALVKLLDLTTDLDGFRDAVNSITLAGGGDIPESVYDAIVFAMDPANFSFVNPNRFALLIGDAPPQSPGDPCFRASFLDAVNAAQAAGVQANLFPIIVPTGF